METTYLKPLPFMAGNRPPSYERREVSRRKEKLFLSVVRVVSILERMGEKLEMRPMHHGAMRNEMGERAFPRAESVNANDFIMRTRFGLILKITERTKSYSLPKMRYFTKQPNPQAELPLFSRLSHFNTIKEG